MIGERRSLKRKFYIKWTTPWGGSAFTKFDEYSNCIATIAIITMEYEITNNVNWTNWGVWIYYTIADEHG